MDASNASAILARSHHLKAAARTTCRHARDLRADARSSRQTLRMLFQTRPARRRVRLARGGSGGLDLPTWPGDGLTETTERICPSCGDRAVRPNGHVLAVNGVLKAVYLCKACEKPFVF